MGFVNIDIRLLEDEKHQYRKMSMSEVDMLAIHTSMEIMTGRYIYLPVMISIEASPFLRPLTSTGLEHQSVQVPTLHAKLHTQTAVFARPGKQTWVTSVEVSATLQKSNSILVIYLNRCKILCGVMELVEGQV